MDKTFPLASGEKPADPELRAIGFLCDMPRTDIRAVWTGEKRKPRKGEWYLSGAIIEAYKSPNDLSTEFHIAKLVRCTREYRVAE